jgi:histidinol-phosphate phosphatase family protein
MVNADDPALRANRLGLLAKLHAAMNQVADISKLSAEPGTAMPTKLVILDRDGVINFDSAQFIKNPAEWKPIPGSLEAIARLNQNGYRVVVATNQSGVGRGLFDMDTLNQIHAKMHKAVVAVGGRIDAIFYCPHAADSKCDCRKPKPGMFKRISKRSTSTSPACRHR